MLSMTAGAYKHHKMYEANHKEDPTTEISVVNLGHGLKIKKLLFLFICRKEIFLFVVLILSKMISLECSCGQVDRQWGLST